MTGSVGNGEVDGGGAGGVVSDDDVHTLTETNTRFDVKLLLCNKSS